MKVRLVKKEDLMKATSRANLVKVAVQVNGRTGQYSSHRWKNPGAALNVLKETMKRAGVKPTDELEFKNKKTNKTLNEDELIKDYKQSKTTDTLQDFVKKNYTVSKAKEEKTESVEKTKPVNGNDNKEKNRIQYSGGRKNDPIIDGHKLKSMVNQQGFEFKTVGSNFYVKFPYDERIVYMCKTHEGRWNPDSKEWRIPKEKEESFREHVRNLTDWDDRDNDYVAIEYTLKDMWGEEHERYLGAMKVLERPARDRKVQVSDNTVVLQGDFGKSGGSIKHPEVNGGDSPGDIKMMSVVHKGFYDHLINNYGGLFKDNVKVIWEGKIGDTVEEEVEEADEPSVLETQLEGSVKQNRWAYDIRRDFYDNYRNLMNKINNALDPNVKEAKFKQIIEDYVEQKLKDTSSKNWIDSRNRISEREILNSATRSETFDRGQLNDTLPEIDSRFKPIEGGDEALEDVRKRVISTSADEISETLTRIGGYPDAKKLKPDKVEYIDYVLSLFNNTDKSYWERVKAFDDTLRKNDLFSKYDSSVIIRRLQERGLPKLVDDMGNGEKGSDDVENKRMDLYVKLIRAQKLIKKRESGERGVHFKEVEGLDKDSIQKAIEIFESNVSLSYWNDIAEKGIDSIQDLLKEDTTEADLSAYEVIFRSHSKRAREAREARHKNATRVDSKGDYKEVANYGDLKKNLSLLKDSKTEVVGRAAMDMVGLTSPLYVNKETPFILGGSTAHGYCEYDFSNPDNTNNVAEIGVVDYKENRQQSFKTSIHESMHGAFGNIKLSDGSPLATSLTRKNHEGMVEIIGQATTKAAYGDKYKDPIPSYLPFVVDTALRLRSRDEFKGKSVHQIGEYLGEKAIAKDAKYFEDLSGFLDKNKRVGLRGDVVKELSKNTDKVETVAKKEHERSGKGDFEKSNLANLVEQIKAGLITLQGALNSSQYGDVAVVLLYRLLEEDEEAAETLSAFQ